MRFVFFIYTSFYNNITNNEFGTIIENVINIRGLIIGQFILIYNKATTHICSSAAQNSFYFFKCHSNSNLLY